MQNATRYPTKKALWAIIIMLGTGLFCLYAPFIIVAEPVAWYVKVFGSLFFVVMGLSTIWGLFSINYYLTDEHLIISCKPFSYPIPLREIYEVTPSHCILSAPALSLDRLRVKFEGKRFGALISPVNKTRFMNDLLSRCPHLMWRGDRLVKKTDT